LSVSFSGVNFSFGYILFNSCNVFSYMFIIYSLFVLQKYFNKVEALIERTIKLYRMLGNIYSVFLVISLFMLFLLLYKNHYYLVIVLEILLVPLH
jgi:hypothetical protein